MTSDRDEIASVVNAFYAAFTNVERPPAVDTLYELCIERALIINATKSPPDVYDVTAFVEPRRTLLNSGTITNFVERELSASLDIAGPVAYRTSRYEKAWNEGTQRLNGSGTKFIGLVKIESGWKIASVLWYDDKPIGRE